MGNRVDSWWAEGRIGGGGRREGRRKIGKACLLA